MVKRLALILILVLVSSTQTATAALYFEFNPDTYTNSSTVITTGTPISEVFIPQNDYLGGFDFWFGNNSTPTSATVSLYTPTGQLMSTKTIQVPAIADVAGGQRFHIDLPSQTYVNSALKYRVDIIPTNQNLTVYNAPWLKFLGHNAPYLSPYQNGVGMIDGVEQDFSFKFALYESKENVPPIISNLSATVLSAYQTEITFNSNEPVDASVDYGSIGQGYTEHNTYTGTYTFCAQGFAACQILLAVNPGTSYEFQLNAKDAWGNIATAVSTFVTPQLDNPPGQTPDNPDPSSSTGPDTTPPTISNLQIVSLTPKALQVSWHTDEAANSNILISTIPLFLTTDAAFDNTLELEHFLDTGEDLTPDTHYNARITSIDGANNLASVSFTFLTPRTMPVSTPTATPAPLTPTPTTSNVSSSATPSSEPTSTTPPPPGTIETGRSDDGPIISWGEPVSGGSGNGYRIAVFNENNQLVRQFDLPDGTHTTTLKNLENGDYTAIVYANDNGTFKKIAPPVKNIRNQPGPLLRLLVSVWTYLGLGIAVLFVALVAWVIKRKKNLPTPPTDSLKST